MLRNELGSFLVGIATLLFSGAASSEVVIPGGELKPEELLATERLVGIRSFPRQFIVEDRKRQQLIGMPTAVLDEAVSKISESESKLLRLPDNWKIYSADEKVNVLKNAIGGSSVSMVMGAFLPAKDLAPEDMTSAVLTPRISFSEVLGLKGKRVNLQTGYGTLAKQVALGYGFGSVDALYLTALVDTELLAQPVSVVPAEVANGFVDVVALDPIVAQDFQEAYGITMTLPRFQVQYIPEQFAHARNSLEKHPELSRVALKALSEVSFGTPQLYTASERELNIPESATRHHDYYWIEFAISNRSLDDDLIQKIHFLVNLKGEAVVTDLIPFVYGRKETVTENLSAPEAEISVGPTRLRIGQAYSQTVSFEAMRPEIRANGLFEPFFSWQLVGDAAKPGATRFIAIVKVRNSQKWLELKMSAIAEVNRLLGFQSDMASTPEVPFSIRLR